MIFSERKIVLKDLKKLKRKAQVIEPYTSKEYRGNHQKEKIISSIEKYLKQKWYPEVLFKFSGGFKFKYKTFIDSGAYVNCIREGIIPFKYFKKSTHRVWATDGNRL